MSNKQHCQSLIASLLLLSFIIPVSIAWFVYYREDNFNLTTTNQGTLIQPPISWDTLKFTRQNGKIITSQALGRSWKLLYLSTDCSDACEEELLKLRQIRLAFGKDMPRISSILVTLADKPTLDHSTLLSRFPDLTHLWINRQSYLALTQLLEQPLPSESEDTRLPSGLFLVDPLGNIMMNYGTNIRPKAIYKDLHHLLRASQIG